MSKNKDKIHISFPSASAEKVAGSQVLIEFGKEERQQILVECGLIQGGGTVLKEYQENSKKFAFKPKDLTAVFVCHTHADHLSLSPRLYKEGCEAPLIMPYYSKDIAKEMMLDTAKIFLKDSEYLTRHFQKDYSPIYTVDDVQKTVGYIDEYKVGEKHKLNDLVEFQFIPSGHIINSCQLILWIKNGGSIKKIVITSDLGNRSIKQYYVNEFEPVNSANLIIGETTYCNAKRSVKQKDRDKDIEKIEAAIRTVCGGLGNGPHNDKGSVLIPAFSLQRFQVMLTCLYDIFYGKEYDEATGFELPDIYAASPLACKISDLFDTELSKEAGRDKWLQVKQWSKIHFIREFDEVEKRISEDKPTIWVASAGMLNAGNSSFIASKLLPRSKNMILFCGFMAPGTLGAKIKDKKTKTVAIDGNSVPARCNIISLNSFSSHMMHDDLLWYYSSFNFDKIALVHGDFDDKVVFAKQLQEEISKKNKSGKVVCVNKSTTITL